MDPELPVLDREQADMLMVGEDEEEVRELAAELLGLFLSESEEAFAELEDLCRANERALLRQKAHFVAGSAGNLGLSRLNAFLRGIECAIDEGRLKELSGCPAAIREELGQACETFRREFGVPEPG